MVISKFSWILVVNCMYPAFYLSIEDESFELIRKWDIEEQDQHGEHHH